MLYCLEKDWTGIVVEYLDKKWRTCVGTSSQVFALAPEIGKGWRIYLCLAKCLVHIKYLKIPVWLILLHFVCEYSNLLFAFPRSGKTMETRHTNYVVKNPVLLVLFSLNYWKSNLGPNWLCSEGFMKCFNKSGRFLERTKKPKKR